MKKISFHRRILPSLLLVSLALLASGCQGGPPLSAEGATRRIQELGGRVEQLDLGASVSMYLTDPKVTRRAMRAVPALRPVDSVALVPARPVRLPLGAMGNLPALRSLLLRHVRLDEKNVAYINDQLPNLKTLRLIDTAVSDQQLAELRPALRRLRALTLSGEGITNRSLNTLSELDGLRRLRLSSTRVEAEAASELADVNPSLIVDIDGERFRGYEATE